MNEEILISQIQAYQCFGVHRSSLLGAESVVRCAFLVTDDVEFSPRLYLTPPRPCFTHAQSPVAWV